MGRRGPLVALDVAKQFGDADRTGRPATEFQPQRGQRWRGHQPLLFGRQRNLRHAAERLPGNFAREPFVPRRLFHAMLPQVVEQQEGLPAFSFRRIVGGGLDFGDAIGEFVRVQRRRDETRRVGPFQANDLPPNIDSAASA